MEPVTSAPAPAPQPTPQQPLPQTAQQAAEMYEFNFLQLLNFFYSYRLWIAIGTTVCVVLASVFLIFIKQPLYRASITINIDMTAEDRGVSSMQSMSYVQDQIIQNKISLVEQYFDSAEFRSFMYDIVYKGTGRPDLEADRKIIRAAVYRRGMRRKNEIEDWLAGQCDLRGAAEKFRITLSGAASRPKLATAIANIGAYALVEYNRLMLVQRLESLKTFLLGQTAQTKSELKALEESLVALQKRAKIISPEEVRVRANALQVDQEAKLIELNRQYASLNALIAESEADLNYFKGLMQSNGSVSHLYIEQILRRAEVLRYQQAQSSDHAPIQGEEQVGHILEDLAKQLQTSGPVSQSPWEYVKKIETALFELKQKRAQAKSDMESQANAVVQTNREFSGLPESLKNISEVKRNIDLTTALYTTLMTRLQESQIKEAAHTNDLVIVSMAEPPGAPSGLGRMKTMMLAIVGGLILSILPLFLRFVLLPTIRNVKDLTHMGVPIVGEIPWFQSNAYSFISSRLQPKFSRLLIEAPNSSETNAMRFVRFKVDQTMGLKNANPEQLGRVLQISSVNPGEGRSFVAANLADLLSASGVKTCLIDLDFAKQSLISFFPEATTEGSTLTRNFPRECGFVLKRVHPNLFVVKPGAPIKNDMSEVLETHSFHAALNALRMRYDLLILDTPPLTGHMEPVVAAQYADALLLVINQRGTLRTEVEEAIRVLQSSLRLPILGVMNFAFDDIFRAGRRTPKLKLAKSLLKRNPKTPPQAPPTGGPKGTGGGPGGGSGSGAGPSAPSTPEKIAGAKADPIAPPTLVPSSPAVPAAPAASAATASAETANVAKAIEIPLTAVSVEIAAENDADKERKRTDRLDTGGVESLAEAPQPAAAPSSKPNEKLKHRNQRTQPLGSDLMNAPDPDDLRDDVGPSPSRGGGASGPKGKKVS